MKFLQLSYLRDTLNAEYDWETLVTNWLLGTVVKNLINFEKMCLRSQDDLTPNGALYLLRSRTNTAVIAKLCLKNLTVF